MEKDEMSWKLVSSIPLIERLSEVLSVEEISEKLKIACFENIFRIANNDKDDEEIIKQVFLSFIFLIKIDRIKYFGYFYKIHEKKLQKYFIFK